MSTAVRCRAQEHSLCISGMAGDRLPAGTTMTEYTPVHAIRSRGLFLDLTGLDLFGTEGFSALHRVAAGCARTGRAWSLVPDAAVSRSLRIGDATAAVAEAVRTDSDDVPAPETYAEPSACFGPDAVPLHNQLYGGALRMTRNPTDAEDVLHQTMVKESVRFRSFHPRRHHD
jgi:hypothetical protein